MFSLSHARTYNFFSLSLPACQLHLPLLLSLALHRFRIDNTDHIIDVNRGNNKFEYDQVNLICPSYPKKEGSGTETETYIIYNVSSGGQSRFLSAVTLFDCELIVVKGKAVTGLFVMRIVS